MGLIASMTGYGRAEARGSRLAVLVESRSLNHRFLEIGVKLPRGLSAHEAEIRQLAQSRLARGRLDVGVTLRRVGGSPNTVRTDLALAGEYVRAARALGDALGVGGQLGLAELLRLPGVVAVEEAEEDDGETALLLKDAVQTALDELVRMRQTEGAALATDLGSHLDALERWASDTGALLPVAVRRVQDRLRARIHALLEEAPADPGRVVQEAAMLAARSDVAEELARLVSHCGQFRALLAGGGSVGRQLDFLLQEMHREVNTIASKADDAEMVARVLEGRTVVERLREQVQNVE
jgi:uncharacterized protein (TIGR00255 family)